MYHNIHTLPDRDSEMSDPGPGGVPSNLDKRATRKGMYAAA